MRKVGMWVYKNSGGEAIRDKIVEKLRERDIYSYMNLDLRSSFGTPSGIYCNDLNMYDLDLFFSYNAGEQTIYQVYMYEMLDQVIRTVNSFESFKLSEDKFKTNQLLNKAGIATPEFFLCNKNETTKLKELISTWNTKFVYKPVDGWGGIGMVLIEDMASFNTVLSFLNQTDIKYFYLEKFINYDKTDYRIDIVDGKYVSCYGRKAKAGNWKTNITSGGHVFLREPDDKIIQVAKDATRALKMDIAGVDIIYDRDREEYVVLEVNGIPAFATPEQEKMGLKFNNKKIDLIVDMIDRITKEKAQ